FVLVSSRARVERRYDRTRAERHAPLRGNYADRRAGLRERRLRRDGNRFVIPQPVSGPVRGASSGIRKTGALILAGLLVLLLLEPPWLERLQAIGFDAYQRAAPRSVESSPVVVVAIDDSSITAFGQWP